MKFFAESTGKFIIQIPTEWQYKNVEIGSKEVSLFSFELYDNPVGCFQISCYSGKEIPIKFNMKIQNADTSNLEFLKQRIDGVGYVWYAVVDEHIFLAKYIYDNFIENEPQIKLELEKAEVALSTLILISLNNRSYVIEVERHKKFMVALAASNDLKNKAIKNESLIELLIIIANQIDACLRMSIVLKKQLQNKTNRLDIALLFQGENDLPIMEKKIYRQALDLGIIKQITYDKLENLYNERNKVVHRYIITEFKTRDLYEIVYEYEHISETVGLSLKAIEELQFKEGIGVHRGHNPDNGLSENDRNTLSADVNDKHLIEDMYRYIKH